MKKISYSQDCTDFKTERRLKPQCYKCWEGDTQGKRAEENGD